MIAGSGRVKLDDDVVDVERLDGLELLAFGPRHPGDGEVDLEWWTG